MKRIVSALKYVLTHGGRWRQIFPALTTFRLYRRKSGKQEIVADVPPPGSKSIDLDATNSVVDN